MLPFPDATIPECISPTLEEKWTEEPCVGHGGTSKRWFCMCAQRWWMPTKQTAERAAFQAVEQDLVPHYHSGILGLGKIKHLVWDDLDEKQITIPIDKAGLEIVTWTTWVTHGFSEMSCKMYCLAE
jgi:hypothetical protein